MLITRTTFPPVSAANAAARAADMNARLDAIRDAGDVIEILFADGSTSGSCPHHYAVEALSEVEAGHAVVIERHRYDYAPGAPYGSSFDYL